MSCRGCWGLVRFPKYAPPWTASQARRCVTGPKDCMCLDCPAESLALLCSAASPISRLTADLRIVFAALY